MSFLPRSNDMQERWERVNKIASTQGVPPVEVYQVGEAYFVLDGNHRVSVARQMGSDHIEAHVWEFSTPVGLSGEADLNELLIKTE
jgi:poly(3-hydroxybutyrate) depolymerase